MRKCCHQHFLLFPPCFKNHTYCVVELEKATYFSSFGGLRASTEFLRFVCISDNALPPHYILRRLMTLAFDVLPLSFFYISIMKYFCFRLLWRKRLDQTRKWLYGFYRLWTQPYSQGTCKSGTTKHLSEVATAGDQPRPLPRYVAGVWEVYLSRALSLKIFGPQWWPSG